MATTDTILYSLKGATSSTTSTTTSTRTSVFSTGYIDTSWAPKYDNDFRQKSYLQITEAAASSTSSTKSSTTQTLGSDDFWELIITDFTEMHTEKVARNNTLSESFNWFATGPAPIQISLTAHLLTSGTYDHRTKFLYRYVAGFRVRQLTAEERTLRLVIKDTCMNLLIQSISFAETSSMPDYSTLTLSGLAYKYRNMSSQDADLYTGYYGTTSAVSTSAYATEKNPYMDQEKKTDDTSETTSETTANAPSVVSTKGTS